MADVFISYKSEERPTVERIAELLRLYELSVWWDDELRGEIFDQEISLQIASSHAVVVLISRLALQSSWVQGEIVRAGDRIVPVRTDDLPYECLPTQLLTRNVIDLSTWNRQPNHREFPKLLARCIQLKTGQKPMIVTSTGNREASSSNQETMTGPVIKIGQITGGVIQGGIGSTIHTVTLGTVRNEKDREDEQ